MKSGDFFGLLVLLFYLLVLPAGIGAFAQGATGLAVVVVLSITIPTVALFAPIRRRSTPPHPATEREDTAAAPNHT